MAQITSIAPTTELDAINVMLACIGQTPIDQPSLDTPISDDVTLAVQFLRESMRELLTNGWRFNTEFGVEVAPAGTYTWVASDNTSTILNVFKKPAGLLGWRPTRTQAMVGCDLIERVSKRYQEGAPLTNVLVLYDRIQNRDGLEKTAYPYIYIDTVFSVDFSNMPETARRVATISASLKLAERASGSDTFAKFTEDDAKIALRQLVREQKFDRRVSIFDSPSAQLALGYRRSTATGFARPVYRQ